MKHSPIPDLQLALDEAFIEPFASHQWKSPRGRSCWVELEGWQDSIAGPISAVANTGECSYVYEREDAYFSGVNEPDSLYQRLLEWHRGLRAGVERFIPTTPSENDDLTFMHTVADKILVLIERVCETERARCTVG